MLLLGDELPYQNLHIGKKFAHPNDDGGIPHEEACVHVVEKP